MKNKRSIKRYILAAALLFALAAVLGAFVLMNRYYPVKHLDIINDCAKEYNLRPELICAVIRAESQFKSDAVSGMQAGGLMQIMEDTAYWLAPKMGMDDFDFAEIFDPAVNIRMGCFYLNMLVKRYGDEDAALCAYNAGGGNVDAWLANPQYSDDGKTLKYIPFQETRNYVARVRHNKEVYGLILRLFH